MGTVTVGCAAVRPVRMSSVKVTVSFKFDMSSSKSVQVSESVVFYSASGY